MRLPRRSLWAWVWFAIWTIPAGILAFVAFADPAGPVPAFPLWDTSSAIVLVELVGLLVISALMHGRDVRQKAAGFVYVYKAGVRTSYEQQDGPLRGLLTVQSIRSALTVGVLLSLLSHRREMFGDAPMDAATIAANPRMTFFALAVLGLAGSALTTLAAIQSYDYALRFAWNEKAAVKRELIRKAHRLGVFGFYCLMWSLAVAASLGGAAAGLIAASAVFVVMWYYYYFPPPAPETPVAAPPDNQPGGQDASEPS